MRNHTMEHESGRKAGRGSNVGPATMFSGRVLLDTLLDDGRAGAIRVNSVFFEPRGRTFWHSHSVGQTLLVAAGRGMVETRDGEARVLTAGDVVWAPAGEVHWHGAAPDTFLSHTAVSLGQADWGEEVDEEHYRSLFGAL
jgi:quercetin dioxygenase-like cupin family protein